MLAFVSVAQGQVNSGSNGSDGALNPTSNIVINMADHPDGIYQYTSVNISNGVTVTFIPNANNTPVTWLVQSNCVINGTVDVSGQSADGEIRGVGGPGGWAGGSGGSNPSPGQGPGGGAVSLLNVGGGGSFGSQGCIGGPGAGSAGQLYGNAFLLPLLGGSGGGGTSADSPGGGSGGGGAILIAASGFIQLNGSIHAYGGAHDGINWTYGGPGSGGGVRLVTSNFTGNGVIRTDGGVGGCAYAGSGRVRIDAFQNTFGGTLSGIVAQGFQPIIIPVAGQCVQLSIASIAGASVSVSPNGQLLSPDAIISGQQANPIPIVVNCSNLPLNTLITVTVKPVNGSPVSAVGFNTAGTLASSTATVSLNMPRGGGIIYATAATSN